MNPNRSFPGCTMPPANENAPDRGSIMVVDDNPANLKLLEQMLAQREYTVHSFPRGLAALNRATENPPDLILLDINMPEMNGYEVCERLKANPKTSDIPVVFLSALTATQDKVKGFRAGGVDYVSKPFEFAEVLARVDTHVKLKRAQQAERDLLENTLNGAVGTLWELVQLTSPLLAARSQTIREIMTCLIKRMEINDAWEYELAARLCLLGCITLPEEVFEKAYRGAALSPEEEKMFCAHPETAGRLVAKIPRLEGVAEIIRRQQRPDEEPPNSNQPIRGARLLHLALEVDMRLYRSVPLQAALNQVKMSASYYEPAMLSALDSYSQAAVEFEVQSAFIRDLRAGMRLDQDVLTKTGLFIFKAGTVLTDAWVERLGNFLKSQGVQEPLRVRVARLS